MKVQFVSEVIVKNGRISKSSLKGFTKPIADEAYGKEVFAALKPVIHGYVKDRLIDEGGATDVLARVRVTQRRKNQSLEIEVKLVEVTDSVSAG